MQEGDLFDSAASRMLRDAGIESVTANNENWVDNARKLAVHIAKTYGQVSSDDIQRIYPRPASVHQNAVGAVFKTKLLTITGFRQSSRVAAHARRIAVYGTTA